MKRTLIAGPWVGEFGWELFAWQAYLRSLSTKFEKTIVISRSNSAALYEDFADEFVVFDPPDGLADAFFMHGFNPNIALRDILKDNNINLDSSVALLLPRRFGYPPQTDYLEEIQIGAHGVVPKYIQFGKPNTESYDYVFHIRNRQLRKEDNWSLKNWEILAELLGSDKVACIGTTTESAIIPRATDLRGTPLNKVFNLLRNAKATFGPSSGPMHLASLCGCPHVVWSRKENFLRYTRTWNPLGTPVLFDSNHSWHPTPEYIYTEFTKWREA